jgi:hypothetical protein
MNKPHISYRPRDDAARTEVGVLAGVYRFILDCHEKEAVTSPVSCPDVRKENLHDSGNTDIPRPS